MQIEFRWSDRVTRPRIATHADLDRLRKDYSPRAIQWRYPGEVEWRVEPAIPLPPEPPRPARVDWGPHQLQCEVNAEMRAEAELINARARLREARAKEWEHISAFINGGNRKRKAKRKPAERGIMLSPGVELLPPVRQSPKSAC